MKHHYTRFALRVLSGLAMAGALHAQGVDPVAADTPAASAPVTAAPAPASKRVRPAKVSARTRAAAVVLEVTLAPNAKVDPELEADCKFEAILATDVSKALHHARLGGGKPTGTDERVLQVQITDVSGESGGVYTGTKSMRVHVALVIDGKVSDETDLYRYNTGGNPFRGTCHIFRQHTRRLGRDLVGWIKDENFNADDAPMGANDESAE
jgi:hypothetical protein